MTETRTVDEAYASAGNTSDLSVKPDQCTDADVLIAAGMSPGMLGSALIRLHGEWDRAEHHVQAQAADFLSDAAERGGRASDAELAGKAAALARHHNEQQARLLYVSLKTLPKVVEAMSKWASKRGHADPHELSLAVTAYWLDAICRPCNGRGFETIKNTPVLGKLCKRCGGSGTKRVPHGEAGKAALNMMDDCVQKALQSMRLRLRNTM